MSCSATDTLCPRKTAIRSKIANFSHSVYLTPGFREWEFCNGSRAQEARVMPLPEKVTLCPFI